MLASPAYVAVSVLAPALVGVSAQLPAATVPIYPSAPSVAVPVPLGVPPPGAFAETVNVKVTAWPTVDGLGVLPVMVVVVPAEFTAWAAPADALPAKFPSPAYVATSVFA